MDSIHGCIVSAAKANRYHTNEQNGSDADVFGNRPVAILPKIPFVAFTTTVHHFSMHIVRLAALTALFP